MGNTSGRPKSGYYVDGERVPGVTTVIGRFKESGALMYWAWKMGNQGISLDEARDAACDAGSCTHDMIDAHLHGKPFAREEWKEPIAAQADHAFLAFLEWEKQSGLKLIASEISLTSAKHKFGGTFDAAMMAGQNKLVLLDYKTSGGVYPDYLIQVAGGYSLLWQEHRPETLDGMALLRITKPERPDDPVSFHHHYWSAELFPLAQRQFLLFREAYDIDKRLKKMV